MKTRQSPQATPPKQLLSRSQWEQLLRGACQRAAQNQDPREQALKQALGSGKAEQVLRRMSIISDQDLIREFPTLNK